MNETTADSHMTAKPASVAELLVSLFLIAVICLLILHKYRLASILNVNWDEFFYLSNLYAQLNGHGTSLFQRGYVYLFSWLQLLPHDEVGQVNAARLVMVTLLVVCVGLIWKLAYSLVGTMRHSALGVLSYLSAMPVILHGGSFRADSLLAPLLLGAFVLVSTNGRPRLWSALAGLCIGVGAVISVKIVLFVPVLLLYVLLSTPRSGEHNVIRLKVESVICLVASATIVFGVLTLLHAAASTGIDMGSASSFGTRAAEKTVFSGKFAPRRAIFLSYLQWQPLLWLLIAAGVFAAAYRKNYRIASLALLLSPVLFYRNAFPYFYVVMLAPCAVLPALASRELEGFVRRHAREAIAAGVTGALALGLALQALRPALRAPLLDQYAQRQLVSAVHQIFPTPTSYVDRCGMISTFPKLGPFFSTWGLEAYWQGGMPFMRTAIDQRASFVIENHDALNPRTRPYELLLPEDYDLIEKYYPTYWGPIRVAGGRVDVWPSRRQTLRVPFAAPYRIVTEAPEVLVNGVTHHDGDVILVPSNSIDISIPLSSPIAEPIAVTLFLAEAKAPPPVPFRAHVIFTGL